jgi:hypothetical protein
MSSEQNLPEEVKQALQQLATMPVPEKSEAKPVEQAISGTIPAESYPTISARAGRANLAFPDVKNDYELDNALIGQTVKHNGAMVQVPWKSSQLTIRSKSGSGSGPGSVLVWQAKINVQVRPVAAYLVYIKKESIPAGAHESYTLRKKKGFSRQFTTSIEVKAGVSAGIFGCEASLEVTTGFSYSETITDETEETWTRSVTGPRDYWTFQPCLVYAYKIPRPSSTGGGLFPITDSAWDEALKDAFGSLYYARTQDVAYAFAPVYRNSPSIIDREIGYLSLSDVVGYLCNEAWSRW